MRRRLKQTLVHNIECISQSTRRLYRRKSGHLDLGSNIAHLLSFKLYLNRRSNVLESYLHFVAFRR